jgi:hypothetical protein
MEDSLTIEFLLELARKYPNDQALGEALRKILLEKTKDGKTGN